MLYSKIMVPYDGSEHAKHALEYAKGLAATSDAKIAIVHVVPSGVMGVDQIGTEGSLDGVPFGMLNYEQYEGVVRAALDQAKEKVTENLAGLVEDIADIITNKAKSFIVSHKEEPFFLYMGTQDVHVPRVPHPRFAGKSGLGTRGDVILQLDWTIGEIMNTLDSLQLTDNTILIFTSDNGPVIDDGYQDQAFERLNGHTPMGIYRGGKYSAYEAGTRIPFIVRWPAKVKPNKQQALFSQIDIFASLAALLKQPLPEGAAPDSQEHLNTLLGKDYTSREYIVQQNLNNTLAIVKGQWKYIEPSDAPAIEYWTKMELGNDRHPQLYDLSADPSEKNNVAKQHPEVVRELSELLESVKTR